MIKDTVVLNYWNFLLANKTKLWNVHKVWLFPHGLPLHSCFFVSILVWVGGRGLEVLLY